ncbi:hypothetical protein BH24ACT20_BH24ACT20_01360 [soil metagenome]|jgi:hypothetical protein
MTVLGEASRTGSTGCEELESMGLVDTNGCCERCHSAESIFPGGYLGPCNVTLRDGRRTFVCCAAKKQLLGGTGS